MKILYLQQQLILPELHSGNDRCWQFARTWARQGVEVHFITHIPPPLIPSEKAHSVNFSGITIHKIDVHYAHRMGFLRRVISFLRFAWEAWRIGKTIKDIDLVLAYTAPPSVGEVGRRLAAYHKVPFYLEVADVWPDVPLGMGIIRQKLLANFLMRRMNLIYQAARCIFPFSEDMRDMIKAHVPAHPSVEVIHNGADPSFYHLSREASSVEATVRILYTGTLGKANQLSQLLEVLPYLPDEVLSNIQITIVGSGNEEERFREQAESWSCVHFHPPCTRKEISSYLKLADIGLSMFAPYPVLQSNSATKFFDYLAAGLPVLINHKGWQAEYLEKYQCGLSSPQGDAKSLAKNIKLLVLHPERRISMGERGRKLAQQHFDREMLAEQMLSKMLEDTREGKKGY